MGYSLGWARFAASRAEANALIARGLLAAVAFHGLYDFLLFAAPLWGAWTALLVLPLIVVGFLLLRGRIHAALAADQTRARAAAEAARSDEGGPDGPVEQA
jgi:fatty acid desaturase